MVPEIGSCPDADPVSSVSVSARTHAQYAHPNPYPVRSTTSGPVPKKIFRPTEKTDPNQYKDTAINQSSNKIAFFSGHNKENVPSNARPLIGPSGNLPIENTNIYRDTKAKPTELNSTDFPIKVHTQSLTHKRIYLYIRKYIYP